MDDTELSQFVDLLRAASLSVVTIVGTLDVEVVAYWRDEDVESRSRLTFIDTQTGEKTVSQALAPIMEDGKLLAKVRN